MLQRKWLWAVIYCSCKMCGKMCLGWRWKNSFVPFLEFCFWLFANHSLVAGLLSSRVLGGVPVSPAAPVFCWSWCRWASSWSSWTGTTVCFGLRRDGMMIGYLQTNNKNKKLKEEMWTKHTYIHKKNKQRMNEWSCNVSAVDTKLNWLRARWWTAHPSQGRKQTMKRQRRRTALVTP